MTCLIGGPRQSSGMIEIDERAAHEDSGGMDLLVESVFAIDEENVEALPGEQASTLKPGKSGADDSHVVARSHNVSPSPLSRKVQRQKKGRGGSALNVSHLFDQRFHVTQIVFQRAAAGGG